METLFEKCFKGYSTENEDKTAYNKPGMRPVNNATRNDNLLQLCPKPWRYQHAEDTDTTPRWGQFSFYDGGGFVADLGYDNHTGFSLVKKFTKQRLAGQANQSSPGRVFNIQSVSEYFRCRHILLWSWCVRTENSLHANSCSFAWFYGQTLASVLSDLLVSVHSFRFSVLWKRNFQALQL